MQPENELLRRIAELIKREFERFAANHPLGPQLLYSRKQASNLLSISLRSLQVLIDRGDIHVRRIGARRLIPHDELVEVSKKNFDVLWLEKEPNGTRRDVEPDPGDAWYESKT